MIPRVSPVVIQVHHTAAALTGVHVVELAVLRPPGQAGGHTVNMGRREKWFTRWVAELLLD